MVTSDEPSVQAIRSTCTRMGTLCVLSGALMACGGGGDSIGTAGTSPGVEPAAAATASVRSVQKNDPIVYSENAATRKSAEDKCRKETRIGNGEGHARKASRERMRAIRCTERYENGELEVEKVG